MKLTLKLIFNIARQKRFHSRLPKTMKQSIWFTFLSYWKTSDLDLILEDFYKKELY